MSTTEAASRRRTPLRWSRRGRLTPRARGGRVYSPLRSRSNSRSGSHVAVIALSRDGPLWPQRPESAWIALAAAGWLPNESRLRWYTNAPKSAAGSGTLKAPSAKERTRPCYLRSVWQVPQSEGGFYLLLLLIFCKHSMPIILALSASTTVKSTSTTHPHENTVEKPP